MAKCNIMNAEKAQGNKYTAITAKQERARVAIIIRFLMAAKKQLLRRDNNEEEVMM